METKAKILIVDDIEQNLMFLESILEEGLDADFIRAASGREAVAKASENEFALILLDVMMPEMDGIESAEIIREKGRTKCVPIIFVTAEKKEKEFIFKGYAAGAVEYLLKPIDPEILRAKVGFYLQFHKQKTKLEKEITERKKIFRELEENLNDLRSFKAATVGRENKMIELKGEVNALCEELGRPAPHDLSFLN